MVSTFNTLTARSSPVTLQQSHQTVEGRVMKNLLVCGSVDRSIAPFANFVSSVDLIVIGADGTREVFRNKVDGKGRVLMVKGGSEKHFLTNSWEHRLDHAVEDRRCVCVCVCVRERERERQRERQRETERDRERQREHVRVS
jgi:hypothetical protein